MGAENKIKTMVENGFSNKKIAIVLNIDNSYVKSYVKINNFKIKKEQFSDDKINHIVSLYAQGVSAKNLGIKYSIDKRRVQKWAKKNNMLRSKNESHRFTFFNESVFDVINSPQNAYWLGFFYADAYNCYQTNTVSVNLATIDKHHLEKLSNFLELPKNKIKDHSNAIDDKTYYYSSVKIYSQHICNTLKKYGCPQAKSFAIKYPDFLDSQLNVDFIRGLFDGDGSLCKTKCNNEWRFKLVSTKECLDKIKDIILLNLNIRSKYNNISKTNNNTYELCISGNERVYKISEWLYGNSNYNIRLNRKYDKYLELKEQQYNKTLKK